MGGGIGIIGGLVALSYYYREPLQARLIASLDRYLAVPVKIRSVETSIWADFPRLSVVLSDVVVMAPPDAHDTLLKADAVGFSADVLSLLQGENRFERLFVRNGFVHLRQDSRGQWQYRVWKSAEGESSDATFQISLLEVENMRIVVAPYGTDGPYAVDVGSARISINRVPQYTAVALSTQCRLKSGHPMMDGPLRLTARFRWYEGADSLHASTIEGEWDRLQWRGGGAVAFHGKRLPTVHLQLEGTHPAIHRLVERIVPKSPIVDLVASGDLTWRLSVDGPLQHGRWPSLRGSFRMENGGMTFRGIEGRRIRIHGTVHHPGGALNRLQVHVDSARGVVGNQPFEAAVHITAWEPLQVEGYIEHQWNLAEWAAALSHEQLRAHGEIGGRIHFQHASRKWRFQGDLRGGDAPVEIRRGDSLLLRLHRLHLQMEGRRFRLLASQVELNQSKARIKGEYLLDGPWEAHVDAAHLRWQDITAAMGAVGQWMTDSPTADDASSNQLLGTVHLTTRTFEWPPWTLTNARTHLAMTPTGIVMVPLRAQWGQGHLNLDSVAYRWTDSHAALAIGGSLHRIDIQRLFAHFDDWMADVISSRNLRGRADLRGRILLPFDSTGALQTPRMAAEVDLQIDSGQIIDYEPLARMMGFLELNRLRNLRFDRLRNHLSVRNDTLFIPTMNIHSNELSMRLTGYYTFTHFMEYFIHLNLNELLFGKKKYPQQEYGYVPAQRRRGVSVYLHMWGTPDSLEFEFDRRAVKRRLGEGWEPEAQPDAGFEIEWE